MQSAESQLKAKPELAETVCHYSGLRHDHHDDGHIIQKIQKMKMDADIDDLDEYDIDDDDWDGVNDIDCNLSLIHWAVKHNNRRLLER